MRFNSTISGVPSRFQPSKSGFNQWQAQANQQKAMAASGKPSTMMQGALMAGGNPAALGQVQGIIGNAWKNYNPSYSQYAKEGQQAAAQADAFNQRNAALKAKQDQQKNQSGGNTGGGNAGGGYTGQSTIRPPSKLADALTEDAAQNTLAQGYAAGDHRYQTKSLARQGFSLGKGQEFAGARQAAEEMNKAAGQAADIRSQDQLANSRMQSDYQKASELEAQQNAMLQHTLGQSDWARDFAKQSIDAQTQMAYLQAMLQLRLSLMR